MPVAPHTPQDIYGRVPPGGCAKRMQSQRHLKHELGPGKALIFLEPLGHFKRKSIDPRRVITAMSAYASRENKPGCRPPGYVPR